MLIKSFEGFRPRAVQRAEGGWIIGYGHTLSAREGATVSEADAELLLRYDLLPIEKRINEAAPAALNQHQFDALSSFAFSVGLARFDASDVAARLSAGSAGEAADAMMGWPEETAEAGLRRRAAERALFVADPAYPVSLAQLLSAPLPPPAPAEPAPASTQTEAFSAPEPEAVSAPNDPLAAEPADSRSAAVAALLGEPQSDNDDLPVVESTPLPSAPPVDEAAIPVAEGPSDDVITPDEAPAPAEPPRLEALTLEAPVTEVTAPEATQVDGAVSSPTAEAPASDLDAPALSASAIPAAVSTGGTRYLPYAMPAMGPLPGFGTARPVAEEPPTPAPFAPAEALIVEPAPVEAAPLVLTSPEEAPEPVFVRPVWPAEQRAGAEPLAESGLFGEDLSLTQGGGPILPGELSNEAPARFDWSETGAFVIMGAVGLTAFGASMAAFRLASEQAGGGGDTTIIGWVLAVIGFACVGVSSVNLYRRFGLPGGD